MKFLSREEIRQRSRALASSQHDGFRSDMYTVITTEDIINIIEGKGWQPTKAVQVASRKRDPKFAKHAVIFQHPDPSFEFDDPRRPTSKVRAEIMMINSFNGSCKFQLKGGFHSFLCANGCMWMDETMDGYAVAHRNLDITTVHQYVNRFLNTMPAKFSEIRGWENVNLTRDQALEFAKNAGSVRWPDFLRAHPREILIARREEDMNDDLWSTYNRVQENLIKGDFVGTNQENKKQRKVSAVSDIARSAEINQEIWRLATELDSRNNFRTGTLHRVYITETERLQRKKFLSVRFP